MKDGRVDGHIAVNETRFPNGIDGLADKIHDMGLKIGIYSCEYRYKLPSNKTFTDHVSCGRCHLPELPSQSGT